MQIRYQKAQQETLVTYGEILSTSIREDWLKDKHLIILTNQRYYDRFFEKIEQLFFNHPVDWYIFRNQLYVNTLEEWSGLLTYLDRFSTEKEYLFVALGTAGVVDITGFLQKVSVLNGRFWSIPISFQSYVQGLIPVRTISRKHTLPVLQQVNLPERIFIDQTMVSPQREGRLVDLQVFIRMAFVCDYPLLLQLFKQYPNQKQLRITNFTALMDELTAHYQVNGEAIESYGWVFEKAFYQTENGHLLSENMKRFLGFILHLFWDQTVNQWPFQMDPFMVWLNHLGFPIVFPKTISMAEYLANVLRLIGEKGKLISLNQAGELGEEQVVQEKHLITAFQTYQQICRNIRSNEQ